MCILVLPADNFTALRKRLLHFHRLGWRIAYPDVVAENEKMITYNGLWKFCSARSN